MLLTYYKLIGSQWKIGNNKYIGSLSIQKLFIAPVQSGGYLAFYHTQKLISIINILGVLLLANWSKEHISSILLI